MMLTLEKWYEGFKTFLDSQDASTSKYMHSVEDKDKKKTVIFKLDGKTIKIPSEDITVCVNGFREVLYTVIHGRDEIIFGQEYTAESKSCSAKLVFTCDEGMYGFTMDFLQDETHLFDVTVTHENDYVTVGGATAVGNRLRGLPHCVRLDIWGFTREYGDNYVTNAIDAPDYVSMAADEKYVYFYSERSIKHHFADFKESLKIPIRDLWGCMDQAVKLFEQFDSKVNVYSNGNLIEETYTTSCDRLDFTIHTRYAQGHGHYFLTLTIKYGVYSIHIGDNFYNAYYSDSWDPSKDYFYIKVSNSYMQDASPDRLLPHLKEKYLYLKFLLEMTKDVRFQNLSEKGL